MIVVPVFDGPAGAGVPLSTPAANAWTRLPFVQPMRALTRLGIVVETISKFAVSLRGIIPIYTRGSARR